MTLRLHWAAIRSSHLTPQWSGPMQGQVVKRQHTMAAYFPPPLAHSWCQTIIKSSLRLFFITASEATGVGTYIYW